ncbi:hypothetical protein OAD50_04790 [Vicingaceae bacterium]|nr:hypothetical protein [Vicingaceae bacterium]MDB9964369.1 hypothetical protein [Vicingaceae bacterium]
MGKRTNYLLRNLFALIITITLLLGNSVDAHKFYISITDMEYNVTNKSLQISMKLFLEDLDFVLEKENEVNCFLGSEKEHSKSNEFIKAYVNTHFFVEQFKGSLPLTFVGKEVDKDYAWIYLEVKNFKVKDETLLTNSMFIDYFKEQTNKMNYKKEAEVFSFTLFNGNISKEF